MKPNKPAAEMTNEELLTYMDFSVLRPEFTTQYIESLAKWGSEHHVKSICVHSVYTELCAPYATEYTSVAPTIDFPFGNSTTAMRVYQIEEVSKFDCVKEIDVVMNFGMLKSGLYEEVTKDLKACCDAAHKHNIIVKVILETDALTEEEIRQGCECIIAAGGDMIKTSTGFLTGHELEGSCDRVMKIIFDQNKGRTGVKASGCVRNRERFMQLIDMGVDRIGINYTSAPAILGLEEKL